MSGSRGGLEPSLEVLEALSGQGLDAVEVYAKRGRSRRLDVDGDRREGWLVREEGWAVRAAGENGGFFATGSGPPRPDVPWPPPAGAPASLPAPQSIPFWKPPADLDAPLIAEREGFSLIDSIARALEAELPGAILSRAVLDDGSSEADLVSTTGLRLGGLRQRLCALRVEATFGQRGQPRVSTRLYLAEREAKRLAARGIARRLADRLVAMAHGRPPSGPCRELVLAPALAAELLAALVPLLVGPRSGPAGALLPVGAERLVASERVTIVDDGRLPGGLIEAAADGEGMPTRTTTLIEKGRWRQPLLSWSDPFGADQQPSGCALRASWRELPRCGPTHLYIKPDPGLAPATLLDGARDSAYLLGATAPPHIDLETGELEVPVCGFELGEHGARPLAGVTLAGTASDLLHGIKAVARDLQMVPSRGFVGSPTLLVRGLALR